MNKPLANLNVDESPLQWELVAVHKHSIALSWEDRPGIVEYLLTSGDDGGKEIYKGPRNEFVIQSLKSNTPYNWFLGGTRADGKRTKLALIHARTAVRETPVAPESLQAYFVAGIGVILSWRGGSVDGGPLVFQVYRDGVLLDSPQQPPYIDKNPVVGQTHRYSVLVVDNEWHQSEPCYNDEDVYIPDDIAPTDPTDLMVRNVAATVSWRASQDSSGPPMYIVDMNRQELGTVAETEFTVYNIVPGREVEIGVTAIDKAGNRSERATVRFPEQGIP